MKMLAKSLVIGAMLLTSQTTLCTENATAAAAPASVQTPPNIVLILFEDMSPRVGALGDPIARTPTLDTFAKRSMTYSNAYTAAGVCAPSRASLITGRYAPTIGAQHMRTHGVFGMSSGGPQNYYAVPPPEVKAFPELLRAAGYYTSNNYKTDYQFGEPRSIWDENSKTADWSGRAPGQPFFSMFTIMIPHESYLWPTDTAPTSRIEGMVQKRNLAELKYDFERTDPASVEVPPYLPDTLEVRKDIARQYDNITVADEQLAVLLQKLEDDHLLDNSIVIVSTDHGDGLPRAKRSLYDSGLHVPFFVSFPRGEHASERTDRLISFIDIGPTILEWAGIDVPNWMHGLSFSTDGPPESRNYIHATLDRMDNRTYFRRATRDKRYKLIVNYRPQDPYFEHIPFRDALPSMKALWAAQSAGELPPDAAPLFEPLPRYQLYDTDLDPYEVNNLAGRSEYRTIENRLRENTEQWLAGIDDLSFRMNESEMIDDFWKDGEQPVTSQPTIEAQANGLIGVSSSTPGASIEWRCQGQDRWRLYVAPISLECTVVEAVAQRYGYKESTMIQYVVEG